MKRLFKNIICAVLAPVALVSCMDLDENVYDKLPTDEFGTTEKQINAIMAPAYQSLKNMLAYDGPWGAADMTADILIKEWFYLLVDKAFTHHQGCRFANIRSNPTTA